MLYVVRRETNIKYYTEIKKLTRRFTAKEGKFVRAAVMLVGGWVWKREKGS